MNRKAFLKKCACGLCACATADALKPALAAAEAKPPEARHPEDWRLSFVQQRYAKLLGILSNRMDEQTLNATLFELGSYCSGLYDDTHKKFRGDFEGFRKAVKQSTSGDNITCDWGKGIITMASGERTDCFCPLNSRFQNTPKVVCNCSLGWQQHTWETVLQRKVRVELKESVLRGDKRCVFEIRILAQPAPAAATAG
jgi:hypothetical protein